MMRLWTVQDKTVLETLRNDKIYFPNFDKSEYLKQIPAMAGLYNVFLNIFCTLNNTHLNGLVFCFAQMDSNGEVVGIDDFYSFVQKNKRSIKSLWKQFDIKYNIILELEVNEEFLNPMNIDINDFQFLMPPIEPDNIYYHEEDVGNILNEVARGVTRVGKLPSGVIQSHLPYIKPGYVVNTFSMFGLLD